ncbi:MAG: hypothetical protein GC184_05375 [Rhizobiales bacterium]|nr:hypothetical protein [Hyphomicrobiales bacterium]
MLFARRVFLIASIYGIIVLLPGFFMEAQFNAMTPPAITHPEFYYGFFGTAFAAQFFYFTISRDPIRYRPLMPFAIFAKFTFFATCLLLWLDGRMVWSNVFLGSLIDGLIMVMFAIAYAKTPRDKPA